MLKPETENSPSHRGTAVVLGSSFLGVYAHAGFLAALDAADQRPERIAGASAGALAGALFAAGFRGESLFKAATANSLRLSFVDLGGILRLPGVLSTLWSTGIFSGNRAVRYLRKLFRDVDLEGLNLDIAVTDLELYRPMILRAGPLAESVVASCAVPGLFTIRHLKGKRYLDGGIAAELPFEHLITDPQIHTIVLHRISHRAECQRKIPWPRMPEAIGASHQTTSNELHRLRKKLVQDSGKRLIETNTVTPFPGLFSQRRAPTCYQLGYTTGNSVAAELSASKTQ